jgi:hypothetical protein
MQRFVRLPPSARPEMNRRREAEYRGCKIKMQRRATSPMRPDLPIISRHQIKTITQSDRAAIAQGRQSSCAALAIITDRAIVVMVRCPNTGRELSTGIEMDASTFSQLPDIRSNMKCPACGLDHLWAIREAWLGNPAPSLPALPWLFINNRSVGND